MCLVGVAYASVGVPDANTDATYQGSTVYYKDGSQAVKLGSTRTIVNLNNVSKPAQAAVLAAEDRNFYHEPAISPTGIARAVINNVSGGDTQGGSTITQQYVKNFYLNQDRTMTRKFKEMFIAVKVAKKQDKNTILQNYLNTIYFGRNAYGIEAAAHAYFNTTAKNITVPQAAILAANIKQPGYYDPRSKKSKKPEGKQEYQDTVERYAYVLDGMTKMGQLSAPDAAKYKAQGPPMTVKESSSTNGGQTGFLITRVRNALHGMGITDDTINRKGLKIYTTWDKGMLAQSARVANSYLKGHGLPKDTRIGMVTIDPKTGEIRSAYGGKDYLKRQVDDAFYSTAQVGSSFKPYVLATAIDQGIGLRSKMDSRAPIYVTTDGETHPEHVPGAMKVINDEGNATQPVVDLVRATAMSYNTVYVPLGFKAGSQNVYQTAKEAGLPAKAMKAQVGQGGFFLGQTEMRPLDQASGYATIANDGKYITPHSIIKVVYPDGTVKKPTIETRQAIKPEVAHDVQYAMQSVVQNGGTGFRAALPGRQMAGKTGTTNNNRAAWFAGFTPDQYATAVGMWRYQDADEDHNKPAVAYRPMQNIGGLARINGGDYPARIWHDFESQVLQNKPVTQFAGPDYYGTTKLFATPPPTQDPNQGQKMPCLPGQNPVINHCQPNQDNQGQPGYCKNNPNLPGCTQQPPQSTEPTDPVPQPTDTMPTCVPGFPGCNTGTGGNGKKPQTNGLTDLGLAAYVTREYTSGG